MFAGFPVTVMSPATLMTMVVPALLEPFDVTPTRADPLEALPSMIRLPPMFTVSDALPRGAQNCHLPDPVFSTVMLPAIFVVPLFQPRLKLPDQPGQFTVRL